MKLDQINQQRIALLARKAMLRDELDSVNKTLETLAAVAAALEHTQKEQPED